MSSNERDTPEAVIAEAMKSGQYVYRLPSGSFRDANEDVRSLLAQMQQLRTELKVCNSEYVQVTAILGAIRAVLNRDPLMEFMLSYPEVSAAADLMASNEVSPTQEALPIALGFLQGPLPAAPQVPGPEK